MQCAVNSEISGHLESHGMSLLLRDLG